MQLFCRKSSNFTHFLPLVIKKLKLFAADFFFVIGFVNMQLFCLKSVKYPRISVIGCHNILTNDFLIPQFIPLIGMYFMEIFKTYMFFKDLLLNYRIYCSFFPTFECFHCHFSKCKYYETLLK